MRKYFIVKAFLLTIMIIALNSCVTIRENRLMGDVIGFSDDVQTSFKKINNTMYTDPYNLLSSNGRSNMDAFIRNIPDGQNTVGYYALDIALDRVKYVRNKIMHKDPETKYYIILLTDGLDNGSVVAAQNHHKGIYKKIGQKEKSYNGS